MGHGDPRREDRGDGDHNVERVESLADHFAMEDRLEAKTDAHAGEHVERAKAHLEHAVTDPRRPVKVARSREGET